MRVVDLTGDALACGMSACVVGQIGRVRHVWRLGLVTVVLDNGQQYLFWPEELSKVIANS